MKAKEENHGRKTRATRVGQTVIAVNTDGHKIVMKEEHYGERTVIVTLWRRKLDGDRQNECTHDGGGGRAWLRDFGDEKLMETDDGERRSTWRAYHGNVAVWNIHLFVFGSLGPIPHPSQPLARSTGKGWGKGRHIDVGQDSG